MARGHGIRGAERGTPLATSAVMLLLLIACTPGPVGAPMDGLPPRRTLSPSRRWEAMVAEGGALRIRPAGQEAEAIPVDEGVSPDLAFSPDESLLIYARRTPHNEADLWQVALRDGVPEAPRPLLQWPGTEDRPVVSPAGDRVAFVSGRTGIASIWLLDLETAETRQLTNVGLDEAPRAPGSPPRGFVPPPDTASFDWIDEGLRWVADQRAWVADPGAR